jgi:hypothetical protein
MVNAGVYFMTIWKNLCPFRKVCGSFVIFSPIWYVWTKKNLATLELMLTKDTFAANQSKLRLQIRMQYHKFKVSVAHWQKRETWISCPGSSSTIAVYNASAVKPTNCCAR